jgi:hypothetical protein
MVLKEFARSTFEIAPTRSRPQRLFLELARHDPDQSFRLELHDVAGTRIGVSPASLALVQAWRSLSRASWSPLRRSGWVADVSVVELDELDAVFDSFGIGLCCQRYIPLGRRMPLSRLTALRQPLVLGGYVIDGSRRRHADMAGDSRISATGFLGLSHLSNPRRQPSTLISTVFGSTGSSLPDPASSLLDYLWTTLEDDLRLLGLSDTLMIDRQYRTLTPTSSTILWAPNLVTARRTRLVEEPTNGLPAPETRVGTSRHGVATHDVATSVNAGPIWSD